MREQVNELLWWFLKRDVLETPLDLSPFLPGAGGEVRRVPLKCLVQDGHEAQPRGAGACLREFLEDEHVALLGIARGELQKLPKLVNDEEQSLRSTVPDEVRRDRGQRLHECCAGDGLATLRATGKGFEVLDALGQPPRTQSGADVAACGPENCGDERLRCTAHEDREIALPEDRVLGAAI
jgi:hypothetical protein